MAFERWREIPGWSLYEVSNFGSVRSKRYFSKHGHLVGGRTLKLQVRVSKHCPTYKVVRAEFRKDGKVKSLVVARLVLSAFVGPGHGKEARHGDSNPLNNYLSNLSWGSHIENMEDRQNADRTAKGSTNGRAKLDEADVVRIRALCQCGLSQKEIARQFGIARRTVSGIKNRTIWNHV